MECWWAWRKDGDKIRAGDKHEREERPGNNLPWNENFGQMWSTVNGGPKGEECGPEGAGKGEKSFFRGVTAYKK